MNPIFKRKFGCEFEFSTDFYNVADIVVPIIKKIYGREKIDVRYRHFRSKKNKKWHLKTDSSTECELVTPISKFDDIDTIFRVIKEIEKQKVKITKNDAFHLHIGCKDIPKENIIMAWLQIEKIIIKCFAKHRRNNEIYCPKLNNYKVNKNIASVFNTALERASEHHAIISLFYYNSRKTVEFRVSQATYNVDFLKNWVKFCFYFLRYSKNINVVEALCSKTNEINNTEEIMEKFNIRDRHIYEKFLKLG